MGDIKNAKYPLLNDVVVIRPVVIALLVVMHAFTKVPDYLEIPQGYWWFSQFLRCFRMPVIIFIAGYVFGYQTKILHIRAEKRNVQNKRQRKCLSDSNQRGVKVGF